MRWQTGFYVTPQQAEEWFGEHDPTEAVGRLATVSLFGGDPRRCRVLSVKPSTQPWLPGFWVAVGDADSVTFQVVDAFSRRVDGDGKPVEEWVPVQGLHSISYVPE